MKSLLKKIYILIIKIISLILTKIIITRYLKNNEVKKFHIGAGTRKIKDWLNTDIGNKKIMPVIDSTKRFPFNTNTFDYVFSEHMIEHIKYHSNLNTRKRKDDKGLNCNG